MDELEEKIIATNTNYIYKLTTTKLETTTCFNCGGRGFTVEFPYYASKMPNKVNKVGKVNSNLELLLEARNGLNTKISKKS